LRFGLLPLLPRQKTGLRIWRSYFKFWGFPDNFKTRLAAFKLEGDALSRWKAHLRTQVGGDAFIDTCTWVAFREIFYNRLRLPPVTSSYCMRAGIRISGIEMVIGFRTGDRVNRRSGVVMTRVSMCIGVVRTRVLSIGVVRIEVMIQNDRIFEVRIKGLLVGMGMTARVK
nr:zinc finger, CCHC-type, retrotransposon Gag domain protein [Tanacetum cinerariifolium]